MRHGAPPPPPPPLALRTHLRHVSFLRRRGPAAASPRPFVNRTPRAGLRTPDDECRLPSYRPRRPRERPAAEAGGGRQAAPGIRCVVHIFSGKKKAPQRWPFEHRHGTPPPPAPPRREGPHATPSAAPARAPGRPGCRSPASPGGSCTSSAPRRRAPAASSLSPSAAWSRPARCWPGRAAPWIGNGGWGRVWGGAERGREEVWGGGAEGRGEVWERRGNGRSGGRGSRAVLKGGINKGNVSSTEMDVHGDALCFMVKTWAGHKTTETVLNNGWRLAAVGGWLLAVGGWRLVAVGHRRLVVLGNCP